jgi:flavin reductase (DIM6/NTAB) family NADH-FMN oxidoreductase RutF
MKKNIGAQLALYPAPVIVVGAIVNDKPTWTLVAHAGTMAHSHLMVSLVHAHYINQEIIESKKLSVNIVDEAWLKETDRMGVISGNKEDKSESGKIDYHTFKPVLFEFQTYEYFVTGEKVGDCAKMN